MNPKNHQINLLVFLKNLTRENQNLVSQLIKNLSWLAMLFGLSSVRATKPGRETKLSKRKKPATVLSYRVYSMLKFILYRRILASALPGSYLNQGGEELFP
jgi:hypothetical protein